jgi:membrane protease YdiL (CAAX protease family)
LLSLALFLTALIWAVTAHTVANRAANGLSGALNLSVPLLQPLLHQLFFLLLILVGFAVLDWIATRTGSLRGTNALPERSTAGSEFRIGAALGWAILLVAILPAAIAGCLAPSFFLTTPYWIDAAVALLALCFGALASEAAYHGYLYRNLINAVGEASATVLIALLYAAVSAFRPGATLLSVVTTFALGLLFALAYLRTHALWFGWGLHFAFAATTGVLFGLPVAGLDYSNLVQTNTYGREWLSGGLYGPEGAVATLIVALLAIPVLYSFTADFAWSYTYPPIVAAGYEMEAKPPAEHIAMEREARPAAAPLVQILGSTPTAASTMQAIDEHLKSDLRSSDSSS